MYSTSLLGAALALVPLASPSFAAHESNLAYRSPSLNVHTLHVPIDVEHSKRALSNRRRDAGNVTFPYAVASGDPLDDSVILWTRPQPNTNETVCLKWAVATDEAVKKVVKKGEVHTSDKVDYSVKVEAKGLKAFTKYYYQFTNCKGSGKSPVGSFKTLPKESQDVKQLKLAFFSCSNYPNGYFNAYGAAAANAASLDYIQHVGDYIYESKGSEKLRAPQPRRELSTLTDYRQRHASYKTDPDLQSLHSKLAWQTVWDDHEVADNTWSHGSADSNDTAAGEINGVNFTQRKANAVRAYYEWMPIRQVETDDKLRIWRSFKVGKLADFIMLDTRQYNRSITDVYYNTKEVSAHAADKNRTMTGVKQDKWLYRQLDDSKARGASWRLLFQQVIFNRLAQSNESDPYNYDAWDGYQYEREKLLTHIYDKKISDVVILSGDTHAAWAFDTTFQNYTGYDAKSGKGALGVEFGGSAVSSSSSYGTGTDQFYVDRANFLTGRNPGLQFAEGQLRGYVQLTLTPKNITADYYGFYDQQSRNSNATHTASLVVDHGANHLRRPIGKISSFGSVSDRAS